MSERTIKIGGFQYRLRFVSSHSLDLDVKEHTNCELYTARGRRQ